MRIQHFFESVTSMLGDLVSDEAALAGVIIDPVMDRERRGAADRQPATPTSAPASSGPLNRKRSRPGSYRPG